MYEKLYNLVSRSYVSEFNQKVFNYLKSTKWEYNVKIKSRKTTGSAKPGIYLYDGKIYLDAFVRIKFDYHDKAVILSIKEEIDDLYMLLEPLAVAKYIRKVVRECFSGLEDGRLSMYDKLYKKKYNIYTYYGDNGIKVCIGSNRYITNKSKMIDSFSKLSESIEELLEESPFISME